MQLKETNHSYYCSESNYYVDGHRNFGRCEYDNWGDFKDEWFIGSDDLDDDYNHCFRFDILQKRNEDDELIEEYQLWLFFILQRKGNFKPVLIKQITKEDIPDIEAFLHKRWRYLVSQWEEVSNLKS